MNMIRSTLTPPGYYERCNDESALDDVAKIISDASEAIGLLPLETQEAEDIVIDAINALDAIETKLRGKAQAFAEDTPMFDENAEHRTY